MRKGRFKIFQIFYRKREHAKTFFLFQLSLRTFWLFYRAIFRCFALHGRKLHFFPYQMNLPGHLSLPEKILMVCGWESWTFTKKPSGKSKSYFQIFKSKVENLKSKCKNRRSTNKFLDKSEIESRKPKTFCKTTNQSISFARGTKSLWFPD